MSTDELETEALKLTPRERARLAERLLQSLENLSDEENARLWAEEADRRSPTARGWGSRSPIPSFGCTAAQSARPTRSRPACLSRSISP
jgi:hypothetical protein